ncbi:MAG: polyprenyl synthetase family protein [Sandaracinaceae bacterium]|nr:polyprenyl synthetase family protein [Sandaracinaceae bacterium]
MDGWTTEVKAGVEGRLVAFFETERARVTAIAPEADALHGAIEALTMRGGKRLRPAVLYAAFRGVRPDGGLGDVVDACAGLELLQSYLLIHDDWMDGDDERRGGPSVHAALRDAGFERHLADSLAILAGNLACTWSWRLFGTEPRVHEVVLRMHEEVLVGQQLDLMAVEDVSRMHRLKTGSYTLRGPMALGAVIGGATDEQLAAIDSFAAPLGEAFQLRDDLLGTFGDPRDTGKPGNDLRAGKRTALVLAAQRSGAPLRELDAVLGVADAPDAAVDAARDLLVRVGAKRSVEQRLGALLGEARIALAQAPLSQPGVAMLGELVDRLAYREA